MATGMVLYRALPRRDLGDLQLEQRPAFGADQQIAFRQVLLPHLDVVHTTPRPITGQNYKRSLLFQVAAAASV